MDYTFILNDTGKAFTPDGTVLLAKDAEAHNAAIEAVELAQWASQPDEFCGYVSEDDLFFRTWRGVILGGITSRRSWRNNFGSLIVSVRVAGTNSAVYSGRYAPHSRQFIKMRKLCR